VLVVNPPGDEPKQDLMIHAVEALADVSLNHPPEVLAVIDVPP
jgi:hypothetical protein